MVVHQVQSREASAEPEFTSTLASHRLSQIFDPEDADSSGDQDMVSQFVNITNMIDKLSRDAVENDEQDAIHANADKSKKTDLPVSSANSSFHSSKRELSVLETDYNEGFSDNNLAEETVADVNEDTEPSSDVSNEDEDDYDDSNAIVYSCTLGDNVPVIIQTVWKEVNNNDEEDEEEFIGEPVESKLVISFDGKISEMSKEITSSMEITTSVTERSDPASLERSDPASLERSDPARLERSDPASLVVHNTDVTPEEEAIKEIEQHEIMTIINKPPETENQNQELYLDEANYEIVNISASFCEDNQTENNKTEVSDNEYRENGEDTNVSVSQEPKKKKKMLNILLGCFRCTKKQEE